MGIIKISDLTDLTDTSFASAYTVPVDDDEFAEVADDGGASALPAGVVCVLKDGYADGFCDAANNKEACRFDGGDCCESTCGLDYVTTAECGSGDYTCLDPDAEEYDPSEIDDGGDDDDFAGAPPPSPPRHPRAIEHPHSFAPPPSQTANASRLGAEESGTACAQ